MSSSDEVIEFSLEINRNIAFTFGALRMLVFDGLIIRGLLVKLDFYI